MTGEGEGCAFLGIQQGLVGLLFALDHIIAVTVVRSDQEAEAVASVGATIHVQQQAR
jgi:hypothetical protein